MIEGAPPLTPGYFYRVRREVLTNGLMVELRKRRRFLPGSYTVSSSYQGGVRDPKELDRMVLLGTQFAFGKAMSADVDHAIAVGLHERSGDYLGA